MQSDPVVAQRTGSSALSLRRAVVTVLPAGRVIVPGTDSSADERVENDGIIRYNGVPSDIVMCRYKMEEFINGGSFGAVYKATDLYTGMVVALKFFHKGQLPHRDALNEEVVYRKLIAGCSVNARLFAEVLNGGVHDGHRFIAFEMCGPTLLELLNTKKLVPLPRRHVQEFAYQLLQGVAYLHSLGIIHADLKPDNIAIKSSATVSLRYFDPAKGFRHYHRLVSTQLRILDLGGALEERDDGNEGIVGAVNYRAPEISLGLPFDHSVDIFAVGCILAELHLGRELFPHDISSEREHIALVERICGRFPIQLATDVEFLEPGTFCIENGVASVQFPAEEFDANVHTDPLRRLQGAKPVGTRVRDVILGNLLRRFLDPDGCKRLELNQALRHMYFDDLRNRRL